MKLMLALWNESYDKSTQCIKKQRHHFANKDPYSQNCDFSSSHVWMWKLAKCQRINAFELWCWRRFLTVPWTARRSNQSILKKVNPEYSLEGLMLKLKLQYFGHLMWRANSLGKKKNTWILERLRVRRRWDNRGWDGWMISPAPWTWVWTSFERWWRTGKPGMPQSMG